MYWLIVSFLNCCDNHSSQRSIVIQASKSQRWVTSRNHKRTWQEVFNTLLSYFYNLHVVYTSNEYSCPNVHVPAISVPYILHEVNMLLIYTLILFFLPLLPESIPMTSYHMIFHMTVVTCLFIITERKKKRDIKSGKNRWKKRKILVFICTITSIILEDSSVFSSFLLNNFLEFSFEFFY